MQHPFKIRSMDLYRVGCAMVHTDSYGYVIMEMWHSNTSSSTVSYACHASSTC